MAIRYLAFMKECVAVPLLFFLTEVVNKMELKVTEFDVKKKFNVICCRRF